MSRSRYVGGDILKTTGGSYKIYSKENIEIHSLEKIVQLGKTNGVTHNEPENPPSPEIIPKCMVNFRPHDKYNGEYGFDWLRAGDTGQKGDVWFGDIMGKYFEKDNTTVFQDGNSWSNNFHKELSMYDRLLRSYNSFSIPWKKKKRESSYLYTIPTLTLLKGKSAILNLKIEIEEKPNKITLEFKDQNANSFLDLSLKEIGDIRIGKYDKHSYLTINCIKSFDKEQLLYVKADGLFCGALRILPNSSAFRKKINVVFVKVITNINSIYKKGQPVNGGLNFFKQCFNQALVIPSLIVESKNLNCSGNLISSTFRDKFCSKIGGKYYFTKSSGLKEYLEAELNAQFGNKYNGFYTMFFIGDEYPSFDSKGVKDGHVNGFSYFKSTFGVYFDGHNSSTLAHETMHALELAHTFDGISTKAKFTYKAGQTDNLMDYSHWAQFGSISRKSLFLWQWNILNSRIKMK